MKMKIEDILVVTDLDGTLLRKDKSIDSITIETINQYRKRGMKFTFATSRPLEAIKKYIEIMNVDIPLVVSRGSMIVSPDAEILYCDEICNELKREIFNSVDIRDIFFHCAEGLVIHRDNKRNVRFKNEVGDLYKPLDISKVDIFGLHTSQITVLVNEKIDYVPILRQIAQKYGCKCLCTNDGAIIILHNDANKGRGVQRLVEMLNVSEENVIVFGDDINDIEMFSLFDNSVSMANADEDIRRLTKYVTKSNDENGITYCLKEIYKL